MGAEELKKQHGNEGQYGTDKKRSNNQNSIQDELERSAGDRNDEMRRRNLLAPQSLRLSQRKILALVQTLYQMRRSSF